MVLYSMNILQMRTCLCLYLAHTSLYCTDLSKFCSIFMRFQHSQYLDKYNFFVVNYVVFVDHKFNISAEF